MPQIDGPHHDEVLEGLELPWAAEDEPDVTSCCSVTEQATCCDPDEKAACCGAPAGSRCGCR